LRWTAVIDLGISFGNSQVNTEIGPEEGSVEASLSGPQKVVKTKGAISQLAFI